MRRIYAATGVGGSLGVTLFVGMLWMGGWAFLWVLADHIVPIEDNQRLTERPAGLAQTLKLVAVINEVTLAFFGTSLLCWLSER